METIKIKLTGKKGVGQFALIEKEDFDKIKNHSWNLLVCRSGNCYAYSRINKKQVLMHRYILNSSTDEEIDHINGNGLDNRKNNLLDLAIKGGTILG